MTPSTSSSSLLSLPSLNLDPTRVDTIVYVHSYDIDKLFLNCKFDLNESLFKHDDNKEKFVVHLSWLYKYNILN